MTDPRVSVVIAAYNAESYITDAVNSILDQGYADFELLLVEDGSSDSTPDRIAELARRDARIRPVYNKQNIGLAASLNKAFDLVRGDFVARMDADDIALPDRLARQVAYFDRHPECVLLGGNAFLVTANGDPAGQTHHPLSDRDIRSICLFQNPFSHPTVMIRTSLVREHGLRYDTSFDTTQDWALWVDCLQYGKVANLEAPLIKQRLHRHSISIRKRDRQIANSLRIQEKYVKKFLGTEAWHPGAFYEIDTVFLSDRQSACAAGADRAGVCLSALALYKTVVARYGRHEHRGLERFIVDRTIRIGLPFPVSKSWPRLVSYLLTRHFLATVSTLGTLVTGKLRRAVG